MPAALRESVRTAVQAASLREVARDVGMSPSGLRKFLAGSSAYSATRRKLERWYVRRDATLQTDGLTGDSALRVVEVLVQELPPSRHLSATARVVSTLEEVYGAARVRPPGWMDELRGLVSDPDAA
ncbi:MAG TPA: hypothetical protein VFE05_03630 [Longimicrobiaceae bacterium]|nr:hypothetical protein [Longimicrobiaceae bacterium]